MAKWLAYRTYVWYNGDVQDAAVKEAVASELEAEIAQVCGLMNAITGQLVGLIARVLETESWQGAGIRSASQWVAWKCGVSPSRAGALVLMARRLAELPETRAALEAGELCEDQVAVVCRHVPAAVDTEAAELARSATVVQLRRVLGSYPFHDEATGDPTEAKEPEEPKERRRVSFGHTDSGTWQLSAELPPDEGSLVERALVAARDELFRASQQEATDVDWADALVAMADRSLVVHHDPIRTATSSCCTSARMSAGRPRSPAPRARAERGPAALRGLRCPHPARLRGRRPPGERGPGLSHRARSHPDRHRGARPGVPGARV